MVKKRRNVSGIEILNRVVGGGPHPGDFEPFWKEVSINLMEESVPGKGRPGSKGRYVFGLLKSVARRLEQSG